jgi:hypothetical protein
LQCRRSVYDWGGGERVSEVVVHAAAQRYICGIYRKSWPAASFIACCG